MMSRIKVVDVAKFYRHPWSWKKIPALDGLNLQLEKAEVFALVGPNGAGKTTTLKILAGLLRPSHGKIYWNEQKVDSSSPFEVSFLPEESYFYDHLTVQESLDLYGVLWGLPKRERRSRIDRLIEQMELGEKRNQRIRALSKGMHQRLGMAQVLLHPCNVALLDEPMSGLDPIGRREFREIIVTLKNEGRSVLFSTHVLSDVEEVADRVGILIGGKLKETVVLKGKETSARLEEIFLQAVQKEKN
jgi:ABC-2 type transport system ATP-binding protein